MSATSLTLRLMGRPWTLVEVAEAPDVVAAIRAHQAQRLGVIVRPALLDASALSHIVREAVAGGVSLILDTRPDDDTCEAIEDDLQLCGAHVASSLSPHVLVAAHHFARAATPRLDLTAREREIVELVGHGQTNRAIASALFLSEFTVRNHLGRIFRKLGVTTRAEAAEALRLEQLAHGDRHDGSPPAPKH